MTTAISRICQVCGKEFCISSGNRSCPPCQQKERACINCGKIFNSTARKCQACSMVERICIGCHKVFKGKVRKCQECKSALKNCDKCNREFRDLPSRKTCPSCRASVKRACSECGKVTKTMHSKCSNCSYPERICLTPDCEKTYRSSYRYCISCRIKERICTECGKMFRSSGHPRCHSCSITERGRSRHAVRVREYHLKRRITSSDEALSWRTLWAEGLRTCSLCQLEIDGDATRLKDTATLDHIIPLSKGGTHLRDNAQLAHYSCNSAKNNRISTVAGS